MMSTYIHTALRVKIHVVNNEQVAKGHLSYLGSLTPGTELSFTNKPPFGTPHSPFTATPEVISLLA